MTDVVFWVLFGALAGWIGSLVTGADEVRKVLTNAGLGVVGALIGGAIMRHTNIDERTAGLSMPSLLTAVCGAVMLLVLLRSADRSK